MLSVNWARFEQEDSFHCPSSFFAYPFLYFLAEEATSAIYSLYCPPALVSEQSKLYLIPSKETYPTLIMEVAE